jgi:hypothetical protein
MACVVQLRRIRRQERRAKVVHTAQINVMANAADTVAVKTAHLAAAAIRGAAMHAATQAVATTHVDQAKVIRVAAQQAVRERVTMVLATVAFVVVVTRRRQTRGRHARAGRRVIDAV